MWHTCQLQPMCCMCVSLSLSFHLDETFSTKHFPNHSHSAPLHQAKELTHFSNHFPLKRVSVSRFPDRNNQTENLSSRIVFHHNFLENFLLNAFYDIKSEF